MNCNFALSLTQKLHIYLFRVDISCMFALRECLFLVIFTLLSDEFARLRRASRRFYLNFHFLHFLCSAQKVKKMEIEIEICFLFLTHFIIFNHSLQCNEWLKIIKCVRKV
jgi:hypothetical protein